MNETLSSNNFNNCVPMKHRSQQKMVEKCNLKCKGVVECINILSLHYAQLFIAQPIAISNSLDTYFMVF